MPAVDRVEFRVQAGDVDTDGVEGALVLDLRLSSPDSTVLALSEALITGVIRDDDDLAPSFGDASVPP